MATNPGKPTAPHGTLVDFLENPNASAKKVGLAGSGFMMPPARHVPRATMLPPSAAIGKRAAAAAVGVSASAAAAASASGSGAGKAAPIPTGLQSVAVVTTRKARGGEDAEAGADGGAGGSSMAAPSHAPAAMDTDDDQPYDPTRPNDYMAYCRERLEKRDWEERARLRALQEQEMERQRARLRDDREQAELAMVSGGGAGAVSGNAAAALAAAFGASGSAGGVGRGPQQPAPSLGRGRGLSNLPAWMVEQKQAQNAAAAQADQPVTQLGGGGGGGPRGAPQGAGQQQAGPGQFDDAAGGGGVQQQQPGASTAAGQATAAAAAAKKRSLFRNPTKVLLLKNMVGAGEVDEDLEGDVATECGKFGPVRDAAVFECDVTRPEFSSLGPDEAVRCFVRFERQESAIKAFMGMEGRFFAGRTVRCAFYSEAAFEARDLTPKDDEAP